MPISEARMFLYKMANRVMALMVIWLTMLIARITLIARMNKNLILYYRKLMLYTNKFLRVETSVVVEKEMVV